MPIEEWEEVAVGAFSGSVASEGIEQQVTGTQDLPMLGTTDNSFLVNIVLGAGGIAAAWSGAEGMGPLARTESGRNFFAGFGASTLANPIVRKTFGAARAGAVRVTGITSEEKAESETSTGTSTEEATGGF